MKIYFKCISEDHSKAIQETLFEYGYKWRATCLEDRHKFKEDCMYLVLEASEKGYITYSNEFKSIPKTHKFCSLDEFVAHVNDREKVELSCGAKAYVNNFFETINIHNVELSFSDIRLLCFEYDITTD